MIVDESIPVIMSDYYRKWFTPLQQYDSKDSQTLDNIDNNAQNHSIYSPVNQAIFQYDQNMNQQKDGEFCCNNFFHYIHNYLQELNLIETTSYL